MNASPLKKELPFVFSILLIIIALAYANTLRSPFQFDDVKIENDLGIRDLDRFTDTGALRHRHVHSATLALNYDLAGLNPFGYHLFNLFLHSCATLLVFLVSFLTAEKGMLLSRNAAIRVAFAAALLFALNPAISEAVTYISGRPSSLAAVFYMLSLYLFILGSLRDPVLALPRPLIFLFSMTAFLASVSAKEIAMTLPLAAALYDACFMRTEYWVKWKTRLFGFYLLIPGLVVVFMLKFTASVSIFRWWLGEVDYIYALAQIKVITRAVCLFFFPINLRAEYSSHYDFDVTDPVFILSAVFWIGILLIAVKIMRKSSVLLFSALWFLIAISPTNSIIPREDLFSERNLYLPSFGLVFLFSAVFYLLAKTSLGRGYELSPHDPFSSTMGNRRNTVTFCVFGLMVILTAYSALLIKRNLVYQNTLIYWEDAYKKAPQKMRVLHNLSLEYMKVGNQENLFVVLKKMLEINPTYYFARMNLARAYVQQGDFSLAEKEYEGLIKTNPEMFETYFNMASFYAEQGNYERAREFYEKAEKVQGAQKYPALFLYRGKVYFELGLLGHARQDWERYFLMSENANGDFPQQDIIHNLLGLVSVNQNDPQKAIIEFEKAIEINPQFIEPHFNLGKLLLDLKIDLKEAKRHFEEVLTLTTDPQKNEDVRKWIQQAEVDDRNIQTEILLPEEKKLENALRYYRQALVLSVNLAERKEIERMIAWWQEEAVEELIKQGGVLLAEKKSLEDVLRHYRKALDLSSDPAKRKEIEKMIALRQEDVIRQAVGELIQQWDILRAEKEMLENISLYYKQALAISTNPARRREVEKLIASSQTDAVSQAVEGLIRQRDILLAEKRSVENLLPYYRQSLVMSTDLARRSEIKKLIALRQVDAIRQAVIAQVDKGKAQAGKNNPNSALSHFEKALTLNTDPQLNKEIKLLVAGEYFNLGERILDEEKDLENALVYFKKALALEPNPQRAKEIEALASPASRQKFAEAKLDMDQDKIVRAAFHSAIDEEKGMAGSFIDNFKSQANVDVKASINKTYNSNKYFYQPITVLSYGGNSLTGGKVYASSNFQTSYAEQVLDGNLAIGWSSAPSVVANTWIAYDYGAGVKKIPAKVRFYAANIFHPKIWKLQGSNDEEIWETLVVGIAPRKDGWHETAFPNSTAYRYVRFWITEIHDSQPGLMEWEVLERTSSFTHNMVLVSTAREAKVVPTESRIMLYAGSESSINPNVDLKAYISRDNGETWAQVDLTGQGNEGSSRRILSGLVDISSQPSGKSMRWKIETLNNKDLKLYEVALQWK